MTGPVADAAGEQAISGEVPGPNGSPQRGVRRGEVERALRDALLTGRFVPGRPVTLRGLAGELGVSPMPVREALRTVAAGNALEIRENGRIQVPRMTAERFGEILDARLLLEPELARRAAPTLGRGDAAELEAIDTEIDASLENGDVDTYMRLNHAFHFRIYSAAGSSVILPLVETLWLQFGPFMRTVYGRLGTAALVDHHKDAVSAIRAADTEALAAAVAGDIRCGMTLLADAGLAAD
uniref:GntR family transcriptional regulator n=1 Tax=Stappia sp. TaxID=1870903 RepID=UPI003BAC81F5